jgi:lysophospholipase L1-like esterase
VAALILASPAGAQGPPSVLVVGDSLQVGSGPYLEAALGALSAEIDHRTGRGSAEGLSVLRSRLRAQHAAVVFDLGTNDDPGLPDALASNLAAAREAVGTRCLVVATILRPAVGGVTDAGLNAAVRRFAGESPTVQLVDWHGVATGTPGLPYPDGIHARPEGYDLRGRLLARAVKSCLGVGAQGLPPPASTTPPPADLPRLEPAAEPEAPAVALPRLGMPGGFVAVGEAFERAADLLAAAGRDVRQAAGAELPEPVLGAPE